MSVESVNQFLQKIAADPILQSSLATALEADNDREAVTQLGNAQGYQFSSDELWAEIQKRQREFEARQAAGELTDEELEAFAGGLSPLIVFAAVSAAGVVTASVITGSKAAW